jgi:glycosyltransferase involved in cell wall biosynthesis
MPLRLALRWLPPRRNWAAWQHYDEYHPRNRQSFDWCANVKIMVFPRDAGPYQELLYEEMRHYGIEADYIGELTRSQSLNLLLMPLEVVAWRLAGVRLLHIHWIYKFRFPRADLGPMRLAAQVWFCAFLAACKVAKIRLVWTAHNVLPHEQVFWNDVIARRWLVRAADHVIAHSSWTLAAIARLGCKPRATSVIPHGPLEPVGMAQSHLRLPGSNREEIRVLFFGSIREYKGVDDLIEAFLALHTNMPVRLDIVGECGDLTLRQRIERLADRADGRVSLDLRRISDSELTNALGTADLVVLPYRWVTTSGSASLALAHGRPLIVPDLPALADLPNDAVVRYRPFGNGLSEAMASLIESDPATLRIMSAAAQNYARRLDWREIARSTAAAMQAAICGSTDGPPDDS